MLLIAYYAIFKRHKHIFDYEIRYFATPRKAITNETVRLLRRPPVFPGSSATSTYRTVKNPAAASRENRPT